ncbi:MAG: response regulator transcription factor [Balneolaceae bacterium]
MKESILVIDDDKNMTRLLEVVLETSYKATIAHTKDDALKSFTNFSYSAVILDLNLNEEDGFGLISAIRTKSKWLPIIILSGKEKSDDRIKCFKAGVDDYLIKPFNPEELKLRLERSIARHKLIESL